MGVGDFKKAPEGPKIGPMQNFSELTEERKRELGDLAAVAKETVFKPAKLDPRVAEAEQQEEKQWDPTQGVETQFDVGAARTPAESARVNEAVAKLKALQRVLEAERDQPQSEEDLHASSAPTDEDKQNFLRAVLGNRRYEKTYALFGGQLLVTLVELTPKEEDQIFSSLAAGQLTQQINTEEDWMVAFERLRMIHSIKKVSAGGAVYTRDADSEDLDVVTVDSIPEHVNRFKGATTFRAIMQVSRLFRTQLELMLEAALSPDFWIVGGPDSQSPRTPEAPSTTAVYPSPDRGNSSKRSSSIGSGKS
jgi:hypothetical protein